MSFLMTNNDGEGVQMDYFDLKTGNYRDNEVTIARKHQTSSANKMLASSGLRVRNLGLGYKSNMLNNEFVLTLGDDRECRKTVIKYLDVEREICRNREDEQRREQHIKLANGMLTVQGVSHISFRFMNTNQDNGDMGRDYDVQGGVDHRSKQSDFSFDGINPLERGERMQLTCSANRAFAAQEIDRILFYFTNNTYDGSMRLGYNMRNDAMDKPKYPGRSFDDANACKIELFHANFSFVFIFGDFGESS